MLHRVVLHQRLLMHQSQQEPCRQQRHQEQQPLRGLPLDVCLAVLLLVLLLVCCAAGALVMTRSLGPPASIAAPETWMCVIPTAI